MTSPMPVTAPAITHGSKRSARSANIINMPHGADNLLDIIPSSPPRDPALNDFDFMSPAPVAIHTYKNKSGRPLFGVLRVPDGGDGFKRQMVVYGRKGGAEKWYLVDDEEWSAVKKSVLPGGHSPIYGLDKLTARPESSVLYFFDEYVADIAQEKLPDFVTVSGSGEACLDELSARDVTIWPDAGEIGTTEALGAANMLKKIRYGTGESRGRTTGVDLPDHLPDGWNLSALDIGESSIDIKGLAENAVPPDQAFRPFLILPDRFRMTKKGLVYAGDNGDEQVTNTQFHVVAECDRVEGGDAGLLLRWINRGRGMEYVVLKSQISARGSKLLQELRSNNMLFTESTSRRLLDFLGTVQARKFVRTVGTVGWDQASGWGRPTFMLPSGEALGLGSSGQEIRFARSDVDPAKKRAKYASAGTLEEWKTHVAARAIGNSRLILGICLALSSPLLQVLGGTIEPGGIHMWGGNGTGKSTFSNVVASIWGDPRKITTELDGTKTGFENEAELSSCIGLYLEEMKSDDKSISKEIGRIIYMWANRKGGTRSGPNIAIRETKEFDLMFSSTGEYHLKNVIEMSGGTYTGGIEARMTSIQATPPGSTFGILDTIHDAESSKAFVDDLKKNCENLHGTAGRHFIMRLIDDITSNGRQDIQDWFSKSIQNFIQDYVPDGSDNMIHRVGKRFAFMAAVGELAASTYGTLPWPQGEAFQGVGTCFRSWLDDRGGLGAREDILAIQQVRSFIEQHGLNRFEDIAAMRSAITDAGGYISSSRETVGVREITRENTYNYYVFHETWKNIICRGIDPIRAAKAVRDAGALQTGTSGRSLTMQKAIPGQGKTRVYVITSKILQAGDILDDED